MSSRVFFAVLLLAMTASKSSAQANVLPPLTSIVVGELGGPADFSVVFPPKAQQFSLSTGAYIDGLQLTLYNGTPGLTCTFTVAITDHLFPSGSLGTPWLQRQTESVVTGSDSFISFDHAFPSVYLPAGTYYLVVDTRAGPSPCSSSKETALFWVENPPNPPVIGSVGPSFYYYGGWLLVGGQPFEFNLLGPVLMLPPPTGGGLGQIARLVVEGPLTPPLGGPVEAQAGFVNVATGALLKLSPVTLVPGQVQTLDLDLSQFVTLPGERVELSPVLAQVPGAVSPPVQVTTSVQVLDAETGFGTVLAPAPLLGMSSPGLRPQILAGGQIMRIDIVASSQDACVGQVSFNDGNRNALVPPTPINLSPGTGTFIDLKAHALGLEKGQQIEVQPVLTPSSPVGAVALNSVCQASAQVFDTASGRTRTQQSTLAALPAMQ